MPKSKLYDFDTYTVNNNQTTAPQVTNNSPLNVVGQIGASAVNQNKTPIIHKSNPLYGKAFYLPIAGAENNKSYMDFASNPLSQPFSNLNYTYSTVTKDGPSYIPQSKSGILNIDPTIYANLDKGGKGGSGGIYASAPSGSSAIDRQANFQASEAYNQAMNYTNQLLSQLNTGKTSYTDQINMLMDSINNRASFAYDPDTDPLFQQYLASSMESGKTAMQDSMAQASALTGGYGSTYAQGVGNAAYNNFVQDAYNNLPEYYQTALDAYNSETNNLYNRLNMYNVADATEYGRLADAYQNNLNMANDMYGKEYNNYWDALNYDTSMDQYNADQAYKYASLAQDNAQFNAKMAYQQQQDSIDRAYQNRQEALNRLGLNGTSSGEEAKDLDMKYAYDLIDRAQTNGGYGSDAVNAQIADLVNQGYDIDSLLTYADGGAIDKVYAMNNTESNFALVSGKHKKDDAVYQDQYGNTYTYKELINSGVDKSRIKS